MVNSLSTEPYIGRFAPSPSGPLHLGSLSTALASYLQAKSKKGKWLLRIEDIDPPREQISAPKLIQDTLIAHGLVWDEDVSYQSQHHDEYQKTLRKLEEDDRLYHCKCTRKRVKSLGGIYDGKCRHLSLPQNDTAVRFHNQTPVHQFEDELLGLVEATDRSLDEDFIIRRKDKLWAYQLAVVVDDHNQGITEVVRGSDLIQPTFFQLSLFKGLNWSPPQYLHVPVLSYSQGQKLSKQNHAPAIDNMRAIENIRLCLGYLNQTLPPFNYSLFQTLEHAVIHWNLSAIHQVEEIIVPPTK